MQRAARGVGVVKDDKDDRVIEAVVELLKVLTEWAREKVKGEKETNRQRVT